MEGRFIAKDPAGFEGGINLYNYTSANPVNWADPSGLKKFEMIIWLGGNYGHIIVGGGAYDITIRDLKTGQSTMYTMVAVGIGVGLPSFRGSSRPVNFDADDCKKSDSFDGFGYIGGVSIEATIGIKVGGGIKIPHGPFIPGDMISWDRGGFDIGVSHNATYWYH